MWRYSRASSWRCWAGSRGVQGGRPGPVDRVVCKAAIPSAASDRQQCAVRGAGGGTDPESGVSGSGLESAACGGGHGGDPRLSGVAGGDLRGPVAVCGNLLSGGELAAAGDDPGVFAGVGRSGPLAQERSSQAGVCVSVAGGCPRGALRRGGAGRVAVGGETRADDGAGVALSGGVSGRDSRLPQGSRATISVLAIAIAARLAGYRGVTAMGEFAALLDQDQLRAARAF